MLISMVIINSIIIYSIISDVNTIICCSGAKETRRGRATETVGRGP